jgi:hypothetical protein
MYAKKSPHASSTRRVPCPGTGRGRAPIHQYKAVASPALLQTQPKRTPLSNAISSFPRNHHGAAFSSSARRLPCALAGRLGGEVLAHPVHHGRHRPHGVRRFRPEGDDAQPRPELWPRWLQLQGAVPLRRVQHRDEAHPGKLRRNRLMLLRKSISFLAPDSIKGP